MRLNFFWVLISAISSSVNISPFICPIALRSSGYFVSAADMERKRFGKPIWQIIANASFFHLSR